MEVSPLHSGRMFADQKPSEILVVEDDPGLRELYRTALTSAGYAAVAVEDGLAALRVLDASRIPSAVVLDLGLPRVGGRDVHKELRSRSQTRAIPIIIVTGSNVDDLDPRQFACILRKPISADQLLKAVAACLRKR
jgi:CheY-like chemotaxis protein